MTLIYEEHHREGASSSAPSTDRTSAKNEGKKSHMCKISEGQPQLTHELTYRGIHYRQKPSKDSKNDFHPSELKNPEPSKAFYFVIMIALGSLLLPFIPIAANYWYKLIEHEPVNNNPPAYLVNQTYY